MRSRSLGILALLLVLALPAFAGDRVIQNGLDLWQTPGNGRTFIDFEKFPIPAGFFCFKSEPYAGRIVFKGVPVATAEPGALGNTDTIVQRLDDAIFNKRGIATTRIQIRALHFVSVEPIQTKCGAFNVEVRLNGEQPITRMKIVRDNPYGGRFFAPIAVNGKLVFTPLEDKSLGVLELTRDVRFPPNPSISWNDRLPAIAVKTRGFVLTDTDNDRVPDTYLPSTTNFAAGWPAERVPFNREKRLLEEQVLAEGCHIVDDGSAAAEGHCPGGATFYY